MIEKILKILLFVMVFIHLPSLHAQDNNNVTVEGFVYNSATRKPVDFGTVIFLEARKKAYTDSNGKYRIRLKKPGTYTVFVKSSGLRSLKTKITVKNNMKRNFRLGTLSVRSKSITVIGKRDIQKVSRHTMTRRQMKEVPASFGDSISALTSLPGVIRVSGGLFGPLVIRGGEYRGINYFIDDIPIYSPLHYGGIHSVINSNLIDEVDLYASSFPAEFGSALSSVININTVDSVDEFGGYTDLSILSLAALVQVPILKNEENKTFIASPYYKKEKKNKNAGYIIASGRIGYIDLIVLPLIELILGDKINIIPKYWDYQFKAKYYFNSNHSLTCLAFGSRDYFEIKVTNKLNQGNDPLLYGFEANIDQKPHSQGLYYTYQPSDKFMNRLTLYSSLKHSYSYVNFPAEGVNQALKGISINSKPYIFGVKDKFKIQAVKKYLQIRGAAEYSLYYFRINGRTLTTTGSDLSFDISETDSFMPILLNYTIFNHVVGGYIEAKVAYKGLTFVPGIRSEYLQRTGEITWDPRGMISYEFKSKTTISAAGGKYSYFHQINPFIFDYNPQQSKSGRYLVSDKALHLSAGLEQVIDLFTLKIEGFYNNFYDLARDYFHYGPDGTPRETMSSGKIKAYGAEIMLKKDRRENENGVFGWISYTYTQSKFKSGLPPFESVYGNTNNRMGDPYGYRWINYGLEQDHSLKLILGYIHKGHTITGKFQLYTDTPYTPIIWGQQDVNFFNNSGGLYRFYPIYGAPNSRRMPIRHQLDIRYSNTTTYSWGYVKWYIEIINVYNQRSIQNESWDYRLPYVQGYNPIRAVPRNRIALIPNFGVELKF